MKLAYVDSGVWITLIEGLPHYRIKVQQELNDLESQGWEFAVSEAVELEVLIKPTVENRLTIVGVYNNLFATAFHIDTPQELFRKSLKVGIYENLKAYDAIHAAIALENYCNLLVSTDIHFRNLKSLPVHWIDLSSSVLI